MSGDRRVVVYLAGTRWDGVVGTDRRIVTAIGRVVPVIWVDPPHSVLTRGRNGRPEQHRAGRSVVAPGVTRLQVLAPPGSSRPGIRSLAQRFVTRRVLAAVRETGVEVAGIVLASPRARFPAGVHGRRVLYATDDWIAGAAMMGLPVARLRRDLKRTILAADVVAAVSPHLADLLGHEYGVPVDVVANGCDPVIGEAVRPPAVDHRSGRPAAVLVGQLNERLDVAALDAVRSGGTPLVMIGPRTDHDPATVLALDGLIDADGTEWLGELPSADLPAKLATMGVGLTPYSDSAFNRGSFPLKILEYLAAGLPVVSTDLPAVRWLDTDLIEVADGPQDFAVKVREVLGRPRDVDERLRRIEFASTHSWDARAAQLLALLERPAPGHAPARSAQAAHQEERAHSHLE